MGMMTWTTTFRLSPEARRQIESQTYGWVTQSWLRIFVTIFTGTSYICITLEGIELHLPTPVEPLVWALVWAVANLINIHSLHTPMPPRANVPIDILSTIGLILDLVSTILASGQLDIVGKAVLCPALGIAAACQMILAMQACVTCHRVRKQAKRAKMGDAQFGMMYMEEPTRPEYEAQAPPRL
ncbi:MAG: hypothetical protein M1838_005353 [Thelocarpon superellum]|nr:MAG: hypothetical protein M1838_005353 [Thelocarpon superellum]